MPQHEIKACPRCNRAFECKQGNIAECQCTQVALSFEERIFIEGKYVDCLCAACLSVLKFQCQVERHHIFRF